MMKRNILYLAIFACFTIVLHAETLKITDIDYEDYPLLRGSFYLFDDDGIPKYILDRNSLQLTENGNLYPIDQLECSSNNEEPNLSAVLTIDISGSMSDNDGRNLKIAQQAALQWINTMQQGKGQCALITFNSYSSVLSDFSYDTGALTAKINDLKTDGNTNYQDALLNIKTGALTLASKGVYKRNIIFITDGNTDVPLDVNEVITKAKSKGITIYSVVIDMECPSDLKLVANGTDGKWYENIDTPEKARKVFQEIKARAKDYDPCRIEWISTECEPVRQVELQYEANIDESQYYVSTAILPGLDIVPSSSIRFEGINNVSKSLVLFAKNGDIRIDSYSIDNPLFMITNWQGPYDLAEGEYLTLQLQYSAPDSAFNYGEVEFETNSCNRKIYLSGGYHSGHGGATIAVDKPNGGETFGFGETTEILWSGTLPVDSVSLEYSTDNGSNWKLISYNSTGNSFHWELPAIESTEYLVKATQTKGGTGPGSDTLLTLGKLVAATISHDGTMIANATEQGLVFVRDIISGKVLSLFSYETEEPLEYLRFHKSGRLLAGANTDGELFLWDMESGEEVYHESVCPQSLKGLDFAVLGTELACACDNGRLWVKYEDGDIKVGKISDHNVKHVEYTPDGKYVTVNDIQGDIHFIDASDYLWDHKIVLNADNFRFSHTGDTIAVSTYHGDMFLFSISDSAELMSYHPHTRKVREIYFSKDGRYVSSMGEDSLLYIRDLEGDVFDVQKKKYNNPIIGHAFMPVDTNTLFEFRGEIISEYSVEELEHLRDLLGFKDKSCTRLKVLKNSNYCLSAYIDGKVSLWDLDNLTENATYINHGWAIKAFDVSRDEQLFACNGTQNTYQIADVQTGNILYTLNTPGKTIRALKFSPDAKNIYSGDDKGLIRLMRFQDQHYLKDYNGHTNSITDIELNFDATLMASSSTDNTVRLWQTGTNEVTVFNEHKSSVTSVAFSPEGGMLASADNSGMLIVREVATGLVLWSKMAHRSQIDEITFDNSGEKLLSVGQDSLIKLWDPATGVMLEGISGHKGHVYTGDFSPTSNYLISGSADGTIRKWPLAQSESVQFDESDNTFSVLPVELTMIEIDMGDCPEYSYRTKVMEELVQVDNALTVSVDSMFITGDDAQYFLVAMYDLPQNIDRSSGLDIEFRFLPDEARDYQATVVYIINSVTYSVSIVGHAFVPAFEPVEKIDFLNVEVGIKKELVDRLVLTNVSVSSVQIDTVYVVKENSPFSVQHWNGPVDLPSGQELLLDLAFKPRETGQSSDILVVKGQAGESRIILTGNGTGHCQIVFAQDSVFMGILTENSDFTAKNLLYNNGDLPNQWEFEKQWGLFSIDSIIPPITMPGDSSEIFLSFDYSSSVIGNEYQESIILADSCGYDNVFVINCKIGQAGLLSFSSGTFTAAPGQDVAITVSVSSDADLLKAGITSIHVPIGVDGSLLYPEKKFQSFLQDGLRKLTVTIPIENSYVNTAIVNYRVMLGDVDNCDIIFYPDETKMYGGIMLAEYETGLFVLDAVCREGGDRLITTSDQVSGIRVSPNPANLGLRFDFSTYYPGNVNISLFDNYGRLVSLITDRQYEAGEYTIFGKTDKLPSGTYTYRFSTMTSSVSGQVIIVK